MQTDRRSRRTRRLLQDALIELILQRGYRNLTIQDVTAQADIGYRTFFRHYQSLDELLRDVVGETLEELDRRLDLYRPEANPEGVMQRKGAGLFAFAREREAIFRVLLLDDHVRFALQPLLDSARKRVQAALPPQDKVPADALAHHLVVSTLALLRWWLENDFPQPPERMGEIFFNLIVRPITTLLVEP